MADEEDALGDGSPDAVFPEVLTVHASGAHDRTLIFLHGFRMQASELLEVFVELSKSFPAWKFVLPQAPQMKITAYGGERVASWFDYLTDTGGQQEDSLDFFSLRAMKSRLQDLCLKESQLLPPGRRVCMGGLSQGGCMALHVASHVDLLAVLTIVACRLSQSLPRALRCPWHAVFAKQDEVFPLSWAQPLLAGCTTLKKIEDTHYLEHNDVAELLVGLLREA